MAQRYRTERDGNIDPGYWDPNVGGRQGQRDMGRSDMARGDDEGGWGRPQDDRQRSARDLERDHVQGRRPLQRGDRSENYSQAYDENAETWRQSGSRGAGYGGRGGGDEPRQSATPDLEYDQGWHSNADWSGEGDVVPRYGRGHGGRRRQQARGRGDDEGNYLGQGWDQSGGWDRDSDLFSRGGSRGYGAPGNVSGGSSARAMGRDRNQGEWGRGARGTEGRDWPTRDWRGAEQTTGRDYFGDRDQFGGDRMTGQRTSPYSGSSAGYVTGDAFEDDSFSGEFIGGTDRDYEPDFGRGRRGGSGMSQRGSLHREPGHRGPGHRGKGPKGYERSAERVREEVCEWLADDDLVDASEISVTCGEGGVLVLEGTVDSMAAKHRAEMIADQCTGVREVDSRLRVARPNRRMEQISREQSGRDQGGREESAVEQGQSQGQVQAQAKGQSQDKEGEAGGSRTASSYSMLSASREAEKDRQKH